MVGADYDRLTGRHTTTQALIDKDLGWDRIAKECNKYGPPIKTMLQWRKSWTDIKCRQKDIIRKQQKEANLTVANPSKIRLTPLQQKINEMRNPKLMADIYPETIDIETNYAKLHECFLCSTKFTRKYSLERHMLTHNPPSIKDQHCDNQYNQSYSLLVHKRMHTDEKPYECPECKKKFNRRDNMMAHTRTHKQQPQLKQYLKQKPTTKYTCEYCDKVFAFSYSLVVHRRRHTGEKPFECPECERRFYRKQTLNNHIIRLHGRRQQLQEKQAGDHPETEATICNSELDKSFQCDCCEKRFKQKYNLIMHTRTHTGDKPYECLKCNKRYYRKQHLVSHSRIHELSLQKEGKLEKRFQCDYCEKQFEQKCNLIIHIRTHTGDKPYECLKCNKRYYRKQALVTHSRIHESSLQKEGKLEKRFQCDYCEKRFEQKNKLIMHIRTHTGDKPYECLKCNKRYYRKQHLVTHSRIHEQEIQAGDHTKTCDHCEKQFDQKCKLIMHTRIHTGDKPYECLKCNRRYYRKQHLVNHSRIHENKSIDNMKSTKRYTCEICNKEFNRSYSLALHKIIHTGERPYECPECKKTFYRKQSLVDHQRTHTGEKPYECPLCKKGFYRKQHLVTHSRIHEQNQQRDLQAMESLNTGETNAKPIKKYKCDLCEKEYFNSCSLVMHKRRHTGEKPYECSECKRRFYRQQNLVKHSRIHEWNRKLELQEKQSPSNESVSKCGEIEKKLTHILKQPQKIHKCEDCHKVFKCPAVLVAHRRSHTGEKPYECLVCNKKFILKHHLLKHSRTHERIHQTSLQEMKSLDDNQSKMTKKHQCPDCYKWFKQSYSLVMHRRRHTGERPFECPECEARFYRKKDLTQHNRLHERKRELLKTEQAINNQSASNDDWNNTEMTKKHQCPDCYKWFKQSYSLVMHRRRHTGERPFECPECEARFYRKKDLTQHTRLHGRKRELLKTEQEINNQSASNDNWNNTEMKRSVESCYSKAMILQQNLNDEFQIIINNIKTEKMGTAPIYDAENTEYEQLELKIEKPTSPHEHYNNCYTEVVCKEEVDLSD